MKFYTTEYLANLNREAVTLLDSPEKGSKFIEGIVTKIEELIPCESDNTKNWNSFVNLSAAFIYVSLKGGFQSEEDIYNNFKKVKRKVQNVEVASFMNLLWDGLVGKQYIHLDSAIIDEMLNITEELELGHYLKSVYYLIDISNIDSLLEIDSNTQESILYHVFRSGELGELFYKFYDYDEVFLTIYSISDKEFDVDTILYVLESEEKKRHNEQHIDNLESYVGDLEKYRYGKIDVEELNEEIKRYINNDETFYDLSKYKDVLISLRSGEWTWLRDKDIVKSWDFDRGGYTQDWTKLLVSFFKAVEIYLFEKVFELGNGRMLTKRQNDPNPTMLCDSNKQKAKGYTIGNYSFFIRKNGDRLLKDPFISNQLANKIDHWNNNIRNSKLHKNLVTDYQKVQSVRAETRELLVELSSAFR